jgi:hypothetical protein
MTMTTMTKSAKQAWSWDTCVEPTETGSALICSETWGDRTDPTCPACGGNIYDPFTECLTCEETAKAIQAVRNRAVRERRHQPECNITLLAAMGVTDGDPLAGHRFCTCVPEGVRISPLAERLAESMKDDMYL